jgi:hypothetical protein
MQFSDNPRLKRIVNIALGDLQRENSVRLKAGVCPTTFIVLQAPRGTTQAGTRASVSGFNASLPPRPLEADSHIQSRVLVGILGTERDHLEKLGVDGTIVSLLLSPLQ